MRLPTRHRRIALAAAGLAMLTGCGRAAPAPTEQNRAQETTVFADPPDSTLKNLTVPAAPVPAPVVPKPEVDPTSAEAAGQLVRRYFDLVEAGRYAEARRLFGGGGERSGKTEAEFAADYGRYRVYRAKVGAPGAIEGAAGSRYVELPLDLSGRLADGTAFKSQGKAIVKRVGDVPGATVEQRRWHLDGIVVGSDPPQ
jgi:hypothetical protein